MPNLDPAHVKAVARELCPKQRPCGHCLTQATDMLVDPRPILAALVRAGVLEEQVGFSVNPLSDRRRYVTRWEDADE